MSANWLDRYASQLAEAAIEVGKSYLPRQIRGAIKRGEIELYLLGTAKEINGSNWELRGFRIMHVSDDDNEIELSNRGMPELITPRRYYHPGK